LHVDAQAQRYFPPHVYACAVDEQVFFLDLRRNRYLATTLRELQGLDQWVRDWPPEFAQHNSLSDPRESEVDRRATVASLSRHHLLATRAQPEEKLERSRCPPASRALLAQASSAYPAVSCRELLSFLRAALIAGYRLSACSLYSSIRRIQRRRLRRAGNPQSLDFPSLQHLVGLFRRLRPLLPPTKRSCLLNSLVLLEFLAARGYYPRLVLGVQAHPFSAHCWLQEADVVLGTCLEEVLVFTPILVA
jgi:Transglutaminase-like superfamily